MDENEFQCAGLHVEVVDDACEAKESGWLGLSDSRKTLTLNLSTEKVTALRSRKPSFFLHPLFFIHPHPQFIH